MPPFTTRTQALTTMALAASAGKDMRPAVVLVDPLSTGVMLQRRIFEAGRYRIILVWSDRSQPACRAKHFQRSGYTKEDFAAVVVHEEGKLDQTIKSILSVGAELVSLICGSEFGVLLEDALANGLNSILSSSHLLSSGMADPALKVDKYMQSETVRDFGLAAVRQTLARSQDDVRSFLLALEQLPLEQFKIVVKPQTGSGSVGVTFCDSAEAVWNAYDTIMAGAHKAHCGDKYRHYEKAGVLLQEFMEGAEYIVNCVVRGGVSKCTAMWKYDKRPYNGASFVCYGKQLLAVGDEPQLPEILRYTENVLEALQFRNGSIHAEVIYSEARGPTLVELNCRLHGGNGAWVRPAQFCIGYSQLSVMMDVYHLNDTSDFDSIPSWPEVVHGGCYQVKMRSAVSGTLDGVIQSQLHRIQTLPSYQEHFFSIVPGDKLLLTVDMPSVPGEVTLVHSDKATLEEDYIELNNILHEGLFKVVPEGNVKGSHALLNSPTGVTAIDFFDAENADDE